MSPDVECLGILQRHRFWQVKAGVKLSMSCIGSQAFGLKPRMVYSLWLVSSAYFVVQCLLYMLKRWCLLITLNIYTVSMLVPVFLCFVSRSSH